MKDNSKKNKIVVGVSIALLVIIVIGATYAYLASHQDKSKSADINVTADTTDTLLFKTGKELSFKATTENFTKDGSDLSGSTDATAILRANSTNNQSETFTYNVYLIIAENTFKYTTSDRKPELVLTVTGPDGVVSAPLYTGGSNVTLDEADITNSTGLIKLVLDREISTTSVKEEKWKATVKFKNLDSNQALNGGASFKAKLVLSSEDLSLADYVRLAYEANPNNDSLYYHDSNLANSAGDLSYRYSGSDFALTSKALEEGYTSIYDGLVNRVEDTSKFTYAYDPDYGSKYIYTVLGKLFSDGYVDQTNLNNWVCFGSTDINCPKNNLYRILGVFNVDGEYRVKLIKEIPATSNELGSNGDYYSAGTNTQGILGTVTYYQWNGKLNTKTVNSNIYYNVWSVSELNTVNLNTNYINYINNLDANDADWLGMIADTNWIVGGNKFDTIYNGKLKDIYNAELVNYNKDIEDTYKAKIGLMYLSDYAYANSPRFWNLPVEDYGYSDGVFDNWLYQYTAYTITRAHDTSITNVNLTFVFGITRANELDGFGVNLGGATVRPTFYLKSDTPIYYGSGTKYDPYRIFDTLEINETIGGDFGGLEDINVPSAQ